MKSVVDLHDSREVITFIPMKFVVDSFRDPYPRDAINSLKNAGLLTLVICMSGRTSEVKYYLS